MFDDKGRPSLVGEIGPDPLDKDAESKACLGKKPNITRSLQKRAACHDARTKGLPELHEINHLCEGGATMAVLAMLWGTVTRHSA